MDGKNYQYRFIMSKKSKTKAKEKRLKDKAQRKATQRALYESYMKQGKNTKSKRARKNSKATKSKRVTTESHPDGQCGNPGCTKCFGVYFKAFLVRRQPHNMPQWMWLLWEKLSKEEKKSAVKGKFVVVS